MATWLDDIVMAFQNLNGVSNLKELYLEVQNLRTEPLPVSWQDIIRGVIESYSSDSKAYKNSKNLFYSVDGIGSGIWGLIDYKDATDINTEKGNNSKHKEVLLNRVIRDTTLSRDLKRLHKHKCQICGLSLLLTNGSYSEAHHIKPLAEIHNGPDCASNILILCPNHHVQCDYGAIKIEYTPII